MKHFKFLIWAIHFACIFPAEGANLRGSNATIVQGRFLEAITNNETYPAMPIIVSGTEGRKLVSLHGSDDRYRFRDSSWPFSAVGKVETDSGCCTGTMIGARLMLTAQHCIDRRSNGKTYWMKFTPGYYDGNAPYGSAYAESFWYDYKISDNDEHYDSEFSFDYTVVELDERLGDKTGWWGFKLYDSKWNGEDYWSHVGYGSDIDNGLKPLYHPASPIHSVRHYHKKSDGTKSYLLRHSIDSSGGHSGGPVYGWWESEDNKNMPYIVGVHVASGRASGGQGLINLIRKLKND